MPWTTPTLKAVRGMTRDYVLSQLGARAMIPNSVLRIMSDSMSGLTHMAFIYLDWLARQLLPDTAETEWLDRHGNIWLVNADGSKGRKAPTYARGTVRFEGTPGTVIPTGTLLMGANRIQYQTLTDATVGIDGLGDATAVALTAGIEGNLPDGTNLFFTESGGFAVETITTFGEMSGGVDSETDEQLRERILFRIQNPPMGGAAHDYVAWAMAVPGVTRAWAAVEIGPGTMTVRFLMDDLYPDNYGLPTENDINTVRTYIDRKRPVTVKDCFVFAPILYFYDIQITELVNNTETTRGNIEASIKAMERERSKPGETMHRSWVDEAISKASGEVTHELLYETTEMPAPGYMPVLGTILYDIEPS